MDTSLFVMCLITFFIGFFAILFCILSTCLGVPFRQSIRQLDFSPRGIFEAILYNAPQARDGRRKQQGLAGSKSAFAFGASGQGQAARRMGEDDSFGGEDSYEMMGTSRVGQGRRGL